MGYTFAPRMLSAIKRVDTLKVYPRIGHLQNTTFFNIQESRTIRCAASLSSGTISRINAFLPNNCLRLGGSTALSNHTTARLKESPYLLFSISQIAILWHLNSPTGSHCTAKTGAIRSRPDFVASQIIETQCIQDLGSQD